MNERDLVMNNNPIKVGFMKIWHTDAWGFVGECCFILETLGSNQKQQGSNQKQQASKA